MEGGKRESEHIFLHWKNGAKVGGRDTEVERRRIGKKI